MVMLSFVLLAAAARGTLLDPGGGTEAPAFSKKTGGHSPTGGGIGYIPSLFRLGSGAVPIPRNSLTSPTYAMLGPALRGNAPSMANQVSVYQLQIP